MCKSEQVRRIHVVKRAGYDVEAAGLLLDLQENLELIDLKSIRIFNRYDVTGLNDEEYRQARLHVFAEAPVDDVFDETVDFGEACALLAVEALPGQYDQRADSAAQCIQILTCGERPVCRTARVFAFYGKMSEQELGQVRHWLINPVESREAAMFKPDILDEDLEQPAAIRVVAGFSNFSDEQLTELLQEGAFAMSLADLKVTQQWFRQEQREPSWTELKVLDTYWSDHCRHTTFLTRIQTVEFAGPQDDPLRHKLADVYADYLQRRQALYGSRIDDKPVCLMDLATLAMKELRRQGKLEDLDQSEEINACSIKVSIPVAGRPVDYLVMFKNETHNHPTEIEPFGGAATCLGGAIRDPLSGRSYVYQAMRVTGSGDPTRPVSETLPGKLPQRKITRTAAAGYSSYGNQIGLATGLVEEFYHDGYTAKRLEIGAVIAAAPAVQVRREVPQAGDRVILLGGRTGRDGCGGATGSSKAHTEESILKCGSEVQKGNPPTERKIQRLFRNPEVALMIKRCNDFGAGGVSVAIGELADGLRIDLDLVPRKYEGLDGTELAISESQERMAVVVEAGDVDRFIDAADMENLEAVAVAEVTSERRMIMTWRGETIVDLSRDFIDTNGAPQLTGITVQLPDPARRFFTVGLPKYANAKSSQRPDDKVNNFGKILTKRLADLRNCSRKGLVERFDSTIGAGTLLMPFGGNRQLTPEEGMAALIPLLEGQTDACTLMTFGFDPDLSSWSPYHGAYFAVLQSLSRLVAMGGDYRKARLTFQEYFERLTTQEKWGKPLAALLGAYQAQLDFGVPAIGGKDSMSGSFKDLHVPPTLVSFAVQVSQADRICSAALNEAEAEVWVLPVPLDQMDLPIVPAWLERLHLAMKLHEDGLILSAATVQSAGAAVACVRQCFGNQLGFGFEDRLTLQQLFAPMPGALLLTVKSAAAGKRLDAAGAVLLGKTKLAPMITYAGEAWETTQLTKIWQEPLEKVFPTGTAIDRQAADLSQDMAELAQTAAKAAADSGDLPDSLTAAWMKSRQAPAQVKSRVASPRIFIPVFPGTNCEYDSARAFARAGGQPDVMIIRNLTQQAIQESLDEMEKRIAQAQIVMLPGGFSGGDEPEGSGKFFATAFRNPAITEQVRRLLQQRDGLMLGICNGFQALIKLGILPYGDIRELATDSPTLTFNLIGRHVSRYTRTRIESNRSPWLSQTETGDQHEIPVSHGEGRFAANSAMLKTLIRQKQIATRYVDAQGKPSMLTMDNPNGSDYAIEGIISPDGRVLGKMGHSERQSRYLAQNIPGNKDQKIFEAGVAYFR